MACFRDQNPSNYDSNDLRDAKWNSADPAGNYRNSLDRLKIKRDIIDILEVLLS